ncbi:MAG TPA: stressosome-associated protein Prli42 [Lentibacillus sp.]|nr:stressosome-associated protein Prli42 [Lentibacillus sp.]HLR62467.1 stressosome-associated protein Prli42 [Lentibacillus sp.]
MAKNQTKVQAPRKKSKRERRIKVIIYIMIVAMILSTLTMGLSMFI